MPIPVKRELAERVRPPSLRLRRDHSVAISPKLASYCTRAEVDGGESGIRAEDCERSEQAEA